MALRLTGLGGAAALSVWFAVLIAARTDLRRPPATLVVLGLVTTLLIAPWAVAAKVALAAGGLAGGLLAAVQVDRHDPGPPRRSDRPRPARARTRSALGGADDGGRPFPRRPPRPFPRPDRRSHA